MHQPITWLVESTLKTQHVVSCLFVWRLSMLVAMQHEGARKLTRAGGPETNLEGHRGGELL